jgi:hypothetical protein
VAVSLDRNTHRHNLRHCHGCCHRHCLRRRLCYVNESAQELANTYPAVSILPKPFTFQELRQGMTGIMGSQIKPS